jgi:uncharacterized membrane protein
MFGHILIWLIVDSLILATFWIMPVVKGEDGFFGVRVSGEVYSGPGRRLLRRYRFWLVLTFIEIEAIALAVLIYRAEVPHSRAVSFPLLGAAFLLLYTIFYRQARELRLADGPERVASSLASRSFADYTSVPLELGVMALSILPFLFLIYYYPALPGRVPMHWNWKGNPDSWATKSFGSVFTLPVTAIYLQGLFLLIKHGLMQVKMTLPAEHAEEYFRYKEESLRINMRVMDWLRILLAFLLGGLSSSIVFTAVARFQPLETPAFIVVSLASLLVLVVCGYLITKLVNINRRLKAEVGRVYVQSKSDAEHWYGGGLFYYNPGDPALFVEKLVGFGYTINFGNKSALIYLAYLLVMPLLVAWITKTF